MKTAEQILIENLKIPFFPQEIEELKEEESTKWIYIIYAMKQYAVEAIKEDRENIARNAEDICEIGHYYHPSDYENGTPDEYEYATISKEKLSGLLIPELK